MKSARPSSGAARRWSNSLSCCFALLIRSAASSLDFSKPSSLRGLRVDNRCMGEWVRQSVKILESLLPLVKQLSNNLKIRRLRRLRTTGRSGNLCRYLGRKDGYGHRVRHDATMPGSLLQMAAQASLMLGISYSMSSNQAACEGSKTRVKRQEKYVRGTKGAALLGSLRQNPMWKLLRLLQT